jgi:hypothetical protein
MARTGVLRSTCQSGYADFLRDPKKMAQLLGCVIDPTGIICRN